MNCFELPSISFCLLNYSDIIINSEKKIIDDLHEYNLLEKLNLGKADTKRVFYHHIIHDLCEAVMDVKTNNKIIVYSNIDYMRLELFKYSSRTQIINFLKTLTRKIKNILPIKIYDHEDDYEMFIDRCNSGKGELKSRALMIDAYIKKIQDKRFDFEKAKMFAAQYKLTYLSERYFQNMKVKNLVFL